MIKWNLVKTNDHKFENTGKAVVDEAIYFHLFTFLSKGGATLSTGNSSAATLVKLYYKCF